MKHIIITSFLVFMFVNQSCSGLLDVEPQQSITKDLAISEQNISKLLIGVYEIQGRASSHGGFIQMFSDLLGYEDQVLWNGTWFEPREALSKTMDKNNGLIGGMWDNLYRSISQCNLIIDNLSAIKDEETRKTIEGEAKFLRAFNYFELVRLFGNSSKGVPLRVKSIDDFKEDLSIARATTAEIYTQVQADINDALSLLPDVNSIYADKYAALALSSRISLYRGNYSAALSTANQVILESGRNLAATYDKAFNNDNNGIEDIFSMQVTSQSGNNQLISMYASQENGGRGGDISLSDSFLALFDDPEDVRGHFYYENNFGDLLTNKYVNQFGNVPVFRLAEMYLIRAECNQRLNTALGASPIDDINSIRLRSGASALTAINLTDILKERQRELAFEGFAIYDIKRTNSDIAGLKANSPKLVMPIPQSEMDANKLMEQNEGY